MAEVPEYAEGNREEKANIIRRFIMNAAPGELPQVLRSLKTLTRDDELFFEVAPGFCNEYSMRQQVLYTHSGNPKSANELCRANFNVMTTKHNQLPNLVRRFAKVSGMAKGEASQAVMAYLDLESSHIVDLQAGADDAHPSEQEEFDSIHQVYVAVVPFLGVVIVEIDVVEGHILRGHLIKEGQDNAELPPALQFITELLLPPAATNATELSKSKLREELQNAMDKYVAKAFCATTCGSEAALHAKLHPQEAGAVSACMVFPAILEEGSSASSTPGATTFAVSVSSRHTNLRSLWTGRWKAVYMVTLTPPTESGSLVGEWTCDIVGEAKSHVHYFEEGNVHMESTRVVPKQTLVLITKDAAEDSIELQIAKKVAKQLKKEENAYEAELQEACRTGNGSIGDEAIKGLRRKLPISRQLFDFSVDPSSHGNRSWTRPDQ